MTDGWSYETQAGEAVWAEADSRPEPVPDDVRYQAAGLLTAWWLLARGQGVGPAALDSAGSDLPRIAVDVALLAGRVRRSGLN